MSADKQNDKNKISHRLMVEMREYAIVSLYLWVCFSVLLLYKTAIIQADYVIFLPLSTAGIKALILGKFILVGKTAKVGTRIKSKILLHRIGWKSLAFLLLLIVFAAVEELIVGFTAVS